MLGHGLIVSFCFNKVINGNNGLESRFLGMIGIWVSWFISKRLIFFHKMQSLVKNKGIVI
jgi:hypothetical protein